jgi:hypothetical protein
MTSGQQRDQPLLLAVLPHDPRDVRVLHAVLVVGIDQPVEDQPVTGVRDRLAQLDVATRPG